MPAAADVTSLAGLSQAEVNEIIGSFRNAWSPRSGSGAPNGSFGVTLGGEDPLFHHPVGYIGSFTYSNGQEVRSDETRSLIMATSDGFQPLNESRGATARNSVLWGGILNLSTRIGAGSKLSFNNTYNRGGDNEATELAGENEEFAVDLDVARLTFTQRTVRSHQLTGEHLLGQRHLVDWSFSASRVDRYEPDRSDIAYITEHRSGNRGLPPDCLARRAPVGHPHVRRPGREQLLKARGNYRILLGSSSNPASIKVGGSYRAVSRDVDSRAFDITNRALSEADRQVAPEQIFAGPYAEDSRLSLFINANGGRYDARDHLSAGYAQLELPLGSALRLIGGARLEHWDLDLNTLSPQGLASTTTRNNTDVLPALALNYQLTGNQTVRVSASQTLSRPEYREIASVSSFEPIGGIITFGNPNLQRALIQNYDLRWEWYPRSGELAQHRALRQALRGSDRESTGESDRRARQQFRKRRTSGQLRGRAGAEKEPRFRGAGAGAALGLRQHHAHAEQDHPGQHRYQRTHQH